MARMNEPETMAEYLEFERVRNGYVKNGLCEYCAVQASYGHQHGFRAVLDPCEWCRQIVASFEFDAPNGWRKASRDRLRAPQGWASSRRGIDACLEAHAQLAGVGAAQ